MLLVSSGLPGHWMVQKSEKHVEKSGVPMTGGWGCSKAHQKGSKVEGATVDGRNPKQPVEVEVGSLSHYLQGFSTIPGGAGISPINSITSFHYHIEEVLGDKFCWTVEQLNLWTVHIFPTRNPLKNHKTRNLTTQNKINWVLFLRLNSWFQEARDLHWDRNVLAETRITHCLGHGLCQTCWSMIDSWCHSHRSQWLHWFMLEVLWPCEWYHVFFLLLKGTSINI